MNQAWLRENAEPQAVGGQRSGKGKETWFPNTLWILHAQGGGSQPENGAKWKTEAGLRTSQVNAGMEMGRVLGKRSGNGVTETGLNS